MEQPRRYGRWIALAVVAVVAAVAGFVVTANLGGTEGRARDGAQPAAAPSSTAPPGTVKILTPENVDEVLKDSQVLDGTQARPDLGTPLADCPEAMRFFERPEVKAFQQRFGRAPLPSDGFIGGCPDVRALEDAFRSAQERATADVTP
ncbi:hypothetical protein [Pimelobacter simplex]|uniref:hypothetical protein n=1 Tax=Nocardioides simplex TaxID=2045 RepID=UPI003AB0B00E